MSKAGRGTHPGT